jgi:hypothetical protein
MATGFAAVAWYLNQLEVTLMLRIVTPSVLAVLAVVTVANSMIFSMATYMRAHREEPMLTQSIVVGLLVCFAVFTGSTYGVITMMTLYMCIVVLIALPWTIWLFKKYFNKII